jgi:hypothetical protein
VVDAVEGGGGLVDEVLDGGAMNVVPLDGLGCCGRELLLFLRFDENPREDFSREVIRPQALDEERGRGRGSSGQSRAGFINRRGETQKNEG